MNRFIRAGILCSLLFCGVASSASLELGSKDSFGMHLVNGVESEGGTFVLWSRLNANAMNPNGFITNDFIPYCVIGYKLQKLGSDWHTSGRAVMRLTQTGPEYGMQVGLDGPGVYRWSIHYLPPSAGGFYRHTDHATGVEPWWPAFKLDYRFTVTRQGQLEGTHS
ncbi:iron transporter [Dongshaea marina]|uniref:iron transporter n=1 Tax=Dongshaea marina TaxID=2047966 RepID=UPI000D3EBDF9|nr:iron transporter [Dongshaea marina]